MPLPLVLRISRIPLLLLGLAIGGGACSTADPVEVEEDFMVFPTGRVTWQIRPIDRSTLVDTLARDPAALEVTDEIPGALSLALDLDFALAAGDATQDLDASDVINLDSQDFLGPGRLKIDYDLRLWTFTFRAGGWVQGLMGFEGIVGVSVTDLEMDLEMGSLQESDGDRGVGPLLGARVTYRPVPFLDIYGQFVETAFVGKEVAGSYTNPQFGVVIEPVPGLGIVGGWRFLVYRSDRSGDSDYRIDLSGPHLGVHLRF